MNTHKCPVDGCEAQCRREILMCFRHWQRLPKELQRRVYAAWSKVNRSGEDTEEYFKVRKEAIDVANGVATPQSDLDKRVNERAADAHSRRRWFAGQMRKGETP